MRAMSEIWKPNVTVAAVVERAGLYLLVEEETSDGLRLNQPAGHLEAGESLIDAVIREALEETARPFTPVRLQRVYLSSSLSKSSGLPETYLRFAFVGSVGEAIGGRAFDEGIVRNLWLSADEIRASAARHRSPLVLQCVEDHCIGKFGSALETVYTHPSALHS